MADFTVSVVESPALEVVVELATGIGPQGEPGEQGPQGEQGPPGTDGASTWAAITDKPTTFAPSTHATSHQPGGSDAMTVDAAAATGSLRTLGTSATSATAGNDSRLSDNRTPTDSSVTNAKVDAAAAIAESKLNLASDAAAGTASRRTLGTGATQAAAGNHSHAASAVSFSPTGTVAATDVQAAIAEVASEAVAGVSPAYVQSGAGSLYAAIADGNPAPWTPWFNNGSGIAGAITGTTIGTTAARAWRFRLPTALSVSNVYMFATGSTTGILTAAIYRVSDSVRMWQSGAFNTAVTTWANITANLPVSLAANTNYYMAIAATGASATGVVRVLTLGDSAFFGAEASPLGGRSIGIPVAVTFAVTAGAWPTPMGAVSATTNTAPLFLLEGTAS